MPIEDRPEFRLIAHVGIPFMMEFTACIAPTAEIGTITSFSTTLLPAILRVMVNPTWSELVRDLLWKDLFIIISIRDHLACRRIERGSHESLLLAVGIANDTSTGTAAGPALHFPWTRDCGGLRLLFNTTRQQSWALPLLQELYT
jgi:hypothetical protein